MAEPQPQGVMTPRDRERYEQAKQWILQNKDRQGTPEWEAVTGYYKKMRASPEMQKPFDMETFGQTPAPAPQSPHDANVGMAAALANNVPFGEELATGISTGLSRAQGALGMPGHDPKMDDYSAELDRVRGAEKGYQAEHPWQSFAVSTVPALAAGVGAGLLGMGRATAANVGTPLSRSLQGAAVGGGTGALYGAGAGEGGIENRAMSAGEGALVGGVVGAAAPAVATGVGNLYGAAREALTVNPILSRLGIGKPAAEIVGNAYASDDIMGNALQQMRGAGPNAMLADAGPNAAKMLDQVVQEGGPATEIATRAVNNRANQANQGIQDEFDRRLGHPVAVGSGQEAVRTASAPARQQAYDAAYNLPIDYAGPPGRQIETLLGRVPHEAVNYANRLMRAEGQQSRQVRVNVGPDGTITFERMPDVRQLDYITRALRDVARGAEGQGAMGGTTQAGRAYNSLASELRANLRQAVPEYGAALDTAAGPIRETQAIEFGNRILSPAVTRDEVMMEARGMGGAELRTAAQGVRQHLDDIMANVRRVASDPELDARQGLAQLKEVSSNAAREKIAMLIGDQEANHLFTQMDQAMRAFELRARTATNSMTASRMFANEAKDAATEPGVAGLMLSGEVPKAVKRMVSTATGRTPQRQLARKQDINREVALALTGPRGPAAERYIQDLMRANQQRLLSQNTANQAVRAGRMLAPMAANPTRRMLSENK